MSRDGTRRGRGRELLLVLVSALLSSGGLLMVVSGEDRRTGIGVLAFFALCLAVAIWLLVSKGTVRKSLAARSVEIVGSVPFRVKVGRGALLLGVVAVARREDPSTALRRLSRAVSTNRALYGCDVSIGPATHGLDAVLFLRAVETYVFDPGARPKLARKALDEVGPPGDHSANSRIHPSPAAVSPRGRYSHPTQPR